MTVQITHGVNQDCLPLAGHTIDFVAQSLRDVFNIPQTASAFVNGEEVSPRHIVSDGDHVEFVKGTGQKGGLPDFYSESELIMSLGHERVRRMRRAGITPTQVSVYDSHTVMKWLASQSDAAEGQVVQREQEPVCKCGVTATPATRTIERDGKACVIKGAKQFALMYHLLVDYRPHRLFPFDDLRLVVWGDDMVSDDAIHKTLRRLRKEISDSGIGGIDIKCRARRLELILA